MAIIQRLKPQGLLLVGLGLFLCGLSLAFSSTPSYAQGTDQTPADYVGSLECASCHSDLSRIHAASRHSLALQDVSSDKKAIQADFTLGEKERTVQFPGESAPRPFTADDIAYVIGSGRTVERYVYKVGRKYTIFPAEWNVEKKAWQPYVRGKQWPDDPAYDWTQNCAGCHTTGLNVSRSRWRDDGVQCEACHGPGSNHVDAASKAGSSPTDADLKNIRAAIVLSPDAQVCGQCHSQGQEPENKLPFPVKYQPGMNLLDSAVFDLVAPNDPDHWWATGHAKQTNMQFNEWLRTGHANALTALQSSKDAAPACLECHSADYRLTTQLTNEQKAGTRSGEPPQPLTVQTAKFGVTCTSCHDPHNDTKADFELVNTDTYALCTSCHRDTDVTKTLHHPVQEMFEGQTVIKEVQGIPSVHFTSESGPRCVNCHMPEVPTADSAVRASHSLKPVLPGTTVSADVLKDTCTSCHTDVTVDTMQQFIADSQSDTKARLQAANSALNDSSPAWVRTALDFIQGDGSYGVHNHRYTSTLLNAVEIELGITKVSRPGTPADIPMQNPADCGECHQKEYQVWQTSPHAKASLNDNFQKEYGQQNRPSYCMGCHASGYDTRTGTYIFEGVVCSNCHSTEGNAKHPPAPVKVVTDSVLCGQCHSGAHAPTYDEWLVSAHRAAGIDCVDCHTPHDNGLVQGDVNTTCGGCHKEATVDKVHMGDNMTCVDCHMKRQLDAQGVHFIKTGHSMVIDPETCATCHGKTHLLSGRMVAGAPASNQQVTDLQNEVDQLEATAESNWATGLAGGAIGMFIVGAIGFFILRRGKFL